VEVPTPVVKLVAFRYLTVWRASILLAPTAYAEQPLPVEYFAWPQLAVEGVHAQPTFHTDSLFVMEPKTVLSWANSSIAAVAFVAVTIIEIFMSFKLISSHLPDCA